MSSDSQAEDQYAYKKLENEFKEFLARSFSEMSTMRAELETLRPKAAAYDHLTTLTGVISDLRRGPQTMAPDFLYEVKRRLEKF